MTQRVWQRIGGLCGIGYVLLAILGNEVLGNPEAPAVGSSPQEIGRFVAEHPFTAKNWTGAYLEVVGLLLFIVFAASLWRYLRRFDDAGIVSGTVLGAGLVSAAVKLASIPAAASAYYRGADFPPELTTALIDINDFSFSLTFAINALLAVGVGIMALRTQAFGRSLGWAAVVIAAGLMVGLATTTSEAAFLPMMLFLLWVVAAGISLFRRATTGAVPKEGLDGTTPFPSHLVGKDLSERPDRSTLDSKQLSHQKSTGGSHV